MVDDLVGCKVLIGASCNSVFLRKCKNCTFVVACKQVSPLLTPIFPLHICARENHCSVE